MPRSSRKLSRETAFRIIFARELNCDDMSFTEYELSDEVDLADDDFCNKLVEITSENLEAIDAVISANLTNWKIDRIPKTSLAILRISCAQLMYMKDEIPDRVVINEAVELAKKYGADDDYSFVNGILRNIRKSIASEQ